MVVRLTWKYALNKVDIVKEISVTVIPKCFTELSFLKLSVYVFNKHD